MYYFFISMHVLFPLSYLCTLCCVYKHLFALVVFCSLDSLSRWIWRKLWICTRKLLQCLRWRNVNINHRSVLKLIEFLLTFSCLLCMCRMKTVSDRLLNFWVKPPDFWFDCAGAYNKTIIIYTFKRSNLQCIQALHFVISICVYKPF